MCGIAGILHIKQPQRIDPEVVKGMIGAMRHRGPDGFGMFLDKQIGLGHARLSIIDLSGGAQPIRNEEGTLWIVFNGEIFNYPELREDLRRRGHRFYTTSDTEVIIHLFEETGPSCVDSLNGQFAFAIWDTIKKELFVARDRYGILPLHYTVIDETLIFASEIKSIFTVPGVARRIDPVAMEQIFTFWTTLAGRTVFQDVRELPAGHYMTVSRGLIAVQRYWDIPLVSPGEYFDKPSNELSEGLASLLDDAVRIRLRADVPVGCYVSGGLDSSGITALVKNRFNNDLRTFGIRFEEKTFDESEYQDCLVNHLGTAHTDILARNEDIGALLSKVLWHCEKPLLRTAPVPLFQLSHRVRTSGFKVVLTGEGADEVFGGYDIFREAKILKFWARHPESQSRPRLLSRIYPYIFQSNPRARHFVRSFFGTGLKSVNDPLFSHLLRWDTTKRIRTFFTEEVRGCVGDYSCYEELKQSLPASYAEWDYLSRAQYLEIGIFMSNYLLSSQGDRVAMAHSVELRPPYLDHRLMNFMGRVPPQQRIKGLSEKYLLKESFKELVPEKIRRRQKHPYRAPISTPLLKTGAECIDRYLSDKTLKEAGLFDSGKVERLITKIRAQKHESEFDNMALAGILSTQIIHDQFVGRFCATTDQPVNVGLVIDKRA